MVIRDLLLHCLFIGIVASEFNLMETRRHIRIQEAVIFENCENNYENVILYNELNECSPIFFQKLHDKFHSVTCYNMEYNHSKSITHMKRVDAIFMTVLSLSSVSAAFKEIKKTMWWTVLIPVYILNVKDSDCKFAINTLALLDKNLLTSYLPCIDQKNDIQIYTYNRFARRASSEWIKSRLRQHVTYYRRKYDPTTICKGFNFDRSQKLDGYDVKIALSIEIDHKACHSKYSKYTKTTQEVGCFMKRHHEILNAFRTRLNVTTTLIPINKIKLKKKIKATDEDENYRRDLILCNVGLKFSEDKNLYIGTYPLAWEAIGIATYHHGYKTIGEKIWDFYGIWTILFTIMVLMITFAVIWFFKSERTAFAVFEVIRLLISHNLHTRMNTLPLRIFFITVLIYFLIIHATFNGHLAKFLTHPELKKQVETLTDLEEFGYTADKMHFPINGSVNSEETLTERQNNPRSIRKCLYNILWNDSYACIFDHATLLWYSRREEKLYVSKKSFKDEYYSYFIRRNWPLVNRVNSFFMSLEDFGFRRLWSNDHLTNALIHNLTVTKVRSDEDFHPITLQNLMFSWSILAIGLISATISFCVEVFMTKKSMLSVISFMKNVKDKTLELVTRIIILWPRRFVVFFRKQ